MRVLVIDGQSVELDRARYFGAMESYPQGQAIEDLYRLPDDSWLLYAQYPATLQEPRARILSHEEAVDWLIALKRSREAGNDGASLTRRESQGVPEEIVDHNDPARLTAGSETWSGPPPLGNVVRKVLSQDSKTVRELRERQDALLQPGIVLERVLWPSAAGEHLTAGFKGKKHDDLLVVLRERLARQLFERPSLSVIQSRQDRGCDFLIEWGSHAKFGVQLKSHFDISQEGFAEKTLAQIQDSRQHGLQRLYVMLAGDLADQSQRERVRIFHARVSAMKDPYVKVIPPEVAWTVLFGN
jgi:hypothetical protein